MRCLRIFGVYSYRWSRRHTTVMMIAFLIVGLTIIFQLYAYRHHTHYSKSKTKTGDSKYRPGTFLKHILPLQNRSFCQFNYGLPNELKWGSFVEDLTPEAGTTSPHRVIYNAITGTAYANISKYDAVTYVTQATPEYLYHIVEIARYWDGPISLAVYTPNYDLDITMQLMNHLCHCYSQMSKISLHLFYPKSTPPKMGRHPLVIPTKAPTRTNVTYEEIIRRKIENYRNMTKQNRAAFVENARKKKIKMMMPRILKKKDAAPHLVFRDCSGLDNPSDIQTFRAEHKMIYPINVGRNVARNASRTDYFLVSDIEMHPSEELATKFVEMLRNLMGEKRRKDGCVFSRTVFVVPLFEVEQGEEIPRDKDTLIEMITNKKAVYFHQKICVHCQRFPGMQAWLSAPAPTGVVPFMITRREYPFHRWEPLYFGTQKEPWYPELLSWEGQQDKMTQMLELCLQEYRLVVIDGGFLCHAAAGTKGHHMRAEKINHLRYVKIINGLKRTYPNKPSCKVDWGCS